MSFRRSETRLWLWPVQPCRMQNLGIHWVAAHQRGASMGGLSVRRRFNCSCARTIAVAAILACAAEAQVADTIYTCGSIVTIDDAQPTAEALAVNGGKIRAVGSRAEIEKSHKG